MRAEPRLGWNWIALSERNAWNDVLSRVLADKVKSTAYLRQAKCPQGALRNVDEKEVFLVGSGTLSGNE